MRTMLKSQMQSNVGIAATLHLNEKEFMLILLFVRQNSKTEFCYIRQKIVD